MLGLKVVLTTALAGAVASAGYLPAVNHDVPFAYNVRRQASNGTSGQWNGPYSTKGRDIVDAKGEKITWAGVNWPMSGKSNLLNSRDCAID
jgi:hypothetical protein